MARILIVNKFYYRRGGDCTAALALEQLLKQKGHEVAVFSTRHPLNLESPWSDYFLSEISFSQGGWKGKLKAIDRLFFSSEVKHAFGKLLDDFRPDIVHAHNIHSYISPFILKLAAARGIKVVWTLHDYKLICPAYTCLRNGNPCEACFTDKTAVIRYKCMKNDRKASLFGYLEALAWNRTKLEKYTDAFISPSHFLKEKMKAAGFNPDKIHVLPNFVENMPAPTNEPKKDYYCYVGRISPEKGIENLLEAAKELPYSLKVIGDGNGLEKLSQCFSKNNIEFLGKLPKEKVWKMLEKSRFSVIPSIWYENNPFSAIESLSLGTPVLGAEIGGIPELITPGKNGDLFPPHDKQTLRKKINHYFCHPETWASPGEIAEEARNRFSAQTFYNQLIRIYEQSSL